MVTVGVLRGPELMYPLNGLGTDLTSCVPRPKFAGERIFSGRLNIIRCVPWLPSHAASTSQLDLGSSCSVKFHCCEYPRWTSRNCPEIPVPMPVAAPRLLPVGGLTPFGKGFFSVSKGVSPPSTLVTIGVELVKPVEV